MTTGHDSAQTPDIAVIGLAGRFPGAPDLGAFWRNLRDGVESISRFDADQLRAEGVADELIADDAHVPAWGALDDPDRFDARFFGYSAREASILDPQQRVFLESAWHALEDAGHVPDTFEGQIGVYGGSSMSTYLLTNLLSHRPIDVSADGLELLVANDKDYLASRTSYLLGLDGPAVTVQSACSTSLVAVHLACQALLDFDCDLALAGGATIRLPQRSGYSYQEGMILSPDGHCRPFDAGAAGTVSGNGAGVVVLRRLADALADGDRIDAVIRGTAINNDGASKVGYTAPSLTGQARVIAAALELAGAEPETIGAVEAHGTATPLGDPIEVAALARAFGPGLAAGSCALGSVKSNIGHLDSAAGIASFIKAVLQLRHRQLVPSLNFAEPNPEIDFASTPFRVNTELTEWEPRHGTRRIGVSSFGFGGTNVHAVLEQAQELAREPVSARTRVFPLSAKEPAALAEAASALSDVLSSEAEPSLPDVARTLQEGRAEHGFREVVVATERDDVACAFAGAGVRIRGSASDDPGVAWLLPGQGSQYVGMASALHVAQPVFREAFDACARRLLQTRRIDLHALVLDRDGAQAAARLERTNAAQPALFAVQYGLAKLLESWGLWPRAMLGHSVGEFTAACLAGVFTLDDTLDLVATRGELMDAQPAGSMLSVALDEERATDLLTGELAIAAVNAPEVCVVSGPTPQIRELAQRLADAEIGHRDLHTSHAFHSPMMDPVLDEFAAAVAATARREPALPYVSGRTGDWITPEQATDPQYWARHLREPVRFADGVATLVQRCGLLAELGPGSTLTTLARLCSRDAVVTPTLPGPGSDAGTDEEHVLRAVGTLWANGASVDWAAVRGEDSGRRVSLPGYAFQRRSYWIEPAGQAGRGELPEVAADDEPADFGFVTDGRPQLSTEYVVPRTAVEEHVAGIWQDLLGVSPIGAEDNFVELGGNSLLVTKVVTRIRRELGVEVPLRALVRAGTVAAVAELVTERDPSAGEREPQTADTLQAVGDWDNLHEPFPLSEIQQAQWAGRLTDFSLGNVAAHMYWEVDSDDLDLQRLNAAWNRLMRRHPMLRMVVTEDGQQRILPDVGEYRFAVRDLRDLAEPDRAARLAELRERLSHEIRPSDTWPLFDISAALLPGGRTRLFLSFELMMADMGSVRILLRDWRAMYSDPDVELPELGISFRDYQLAAGQVRDTDMYRRSAEYWRERVPELPPAPALPLAVNPAEVTAPKFVPRTSVIPAAQWETVKSRAAAHGLTPSTVVLAAYACALDTWCRSSRFTLNVTSNLRLPVHPDADQLVGGFASFGLLPVDLSTSPSVLEVAQALQEQNWKDLEYRFVNGVEVLRELARHRGDYTDAAMPVVFTSTLVNEAEHDQSSMVDWLGDLQHEIIQTPQVWLDAAALEIRDGLCVSFPAVDELFPDGLIDEIFAAFCTLLESLGTGDDAAWTTSAELFPADQAALIERVNDTAGENAATGGDLLFSALVRQAEAEPERPAVISSTRTLTYGELRERAYALARRLRELGVGPNQLVGVPIEKSVEQVVAVLGVVLAGGAYLPIDPATPLTRQDYLLTHGKCRCVVVSGKDAGQRVLPDGIREVPLDLDDVDAVAVEPPEWVGSPDDLAYVIFTSGSTGTPKGVMISHRAALNTCVDVNERFGMRAGDKVLGLSALNFDLSVWDIFGVLGAGGSVVYAEPDAGRDPRRWIELITEHGITVWNTVPALLRMLVEHAESFPPTAPSPSAPEGAATGDELPLRIAMLSGDWVPVDLPDRARALAPGCAVYSLGGATEAGIWSVYYPIADVDPAWESIPYGRPLTNQTLHVLDDRMRPCPVWVTGELYIGGLGVADGYWRDPERTAAAFVTDPHTGQGLYRTGDLARRLPDGDLEFLGREDFQVKVGGYRIELGEIEAVLGRHPGVSSAVAAAVGPRHHKRLIAAVVPREDVGEGLADDVRAYAAAHLPGYMVPGVVHVTDELPLSANGKVDRSQLEALGAVRAEVAAPVEAGPVALRLCALAAEIIDLPEVDPYQNFFELGGDSITGIRVITRANAAGIGVVLQDLFEAGSIAELGALVEARDGVDGGGGATVHLTPAQHALLVDGCPPGGAHRFELPVEAEPDTVRDALFAMLSRHDTFRMRFAYDEADGWSQTRAELTAADCHAPLIELGGLAPHRHAAALREMTAQLQAELDPVRGPLFKASLFDFGESGRTLVLLLHELIADARSAMLLAAELEQALEQLKRGEEPLLALPGDTPAAWAAALPENARETLAGTRRDSDAEYQDAGSGAVDRGETHALRDAAWSAYRMPLEHVVVAAVVASGLAGDAPVELETDGRALLPAGCDVTRAAGSFESVLTVDAGGDRDLAALLPAVKASIRDAVDRESDGPASRPGVRVRWLGEPESPVLPVLAGSRRADAPLTVVAAVLDGQLHVAAEQDPSVSGEPVAALVESLRRIVAHCRAPGAGRVTTADFPLAGLDATELSGLLGELAGEGV